MSRKYFVLCEDDCKFEGMTKEQILAAIAEATGNTPQGIDEAFISQIVNQNNGSSLKIWMGTRAEYNALTEKDAGTVYHITDDKTPQEAWNKAAAAEATAQAAEEIATGAETKVNNAMPKAGGDFEGAVNIPTMICLVGDSWNAFTWKSTDEKTRGSVMISNNNRIHFNQQQTGSEFEERYQLPELTTGLTADAWYNIITSKGGIFTGTARARHDKRTITYSPGELVNISIRDSGGTAVETGFLLMYRK